uniref:Reverse transcriptase domain-containing protein n=1 Tax=Tanacetum cinerariifolium TaxID=118510 RepID=A0A699IJB6_TANCI|nr:reverse transcriptase domain-containing protein [Tanacetum cinerariifolium]
MSSASSAVTCTSVYTDSEPGSVFWGADEELSDGEPQTPPAPQNEDEHEPMFIQLHNPNFVPEPIYPKYIPLEDEHILSAEEQPLPPVVLPTAESPGYVAESDPEEDLEEYEDDETENGPVDYPMDKGDDGDDDDGDSSGDDADDEDEEEYLALADSAVIIPTDELVAPPEGTKLVIPPPSTDTATTGARITVRLQAAISFPPEAEVERLLAMPTPSPSPLTSLSPPSTRERLARCMASAALPSPPLPSPLHMPPPVDRKDDIPETEMPPRKKLCLSTLGSRYKVEESSTARPVGGQGTDYGFVSTLDAKAGRQGIGEDSRTRISQRVIVDSQQVDLLIEDKIAHQETIQIVEDEAYAAREAWAHSIGLSQAIHSELQTHQEQVRIMAPVTRQGPSTFPNNANPNNMTLEFIQAMIDQALLRNSTNGDGSHSSNEDNEGMCRLGCAVENQVKFATCSLLDAALTWWNSQIRSLGPDAYSMTWEVLKKKMTDKYCPQGEIKKLEIELWNLKVKENNVSAYNERFQELTLICTKFVSDETEKIDKNFASMQKGSQTTKERLMSHSEITMVTNSRPPKGKMSPGFTIWGQMRGSRTVGICLKVLATQTLRMLRETMGQILKEMVVSNVEPQSISRGTAQSKGIRMRKRRESRLTVILYLKAQEYMEKGCQIFLAHISANKEEDKSKGKHLEDVPVIRDYPEVFPKDLSGLPRA